ncbi:tripartite tricarboxylate transporter substrate binding protein [Limnohabitans sp. DM1]|uniref:Bug family tripartite tricarboxylate transporter substrate binding protein n=1 Tax=Limnohabitans sp. DM1 TaxID=1597955 RepID=UPI000B1BB34D|nr:tripartite tricarboxylate transporter substrate-binding protein [Limnohabitans sp. DM1]
MTHRRHALSFIAAASLLAMAPSWVNAQAKPLKIWVGYPAGGAVDVVARQMAEELRVLGYNAIVENKTGAAGQLATEAMLAAPADGSTVVLMPGGNATIFPHVHPNLRYSMADLKPLASVCSFTFALGVGLGTPAKTLKEFVDWAKANPGKASYGTPGAGTAMHFMGVMFGRLAGIDFQHVPYRGGAAAMTDVLGGNIPALATTLPNLVTHHKSGKLHILAFSGDQPLPSLPGVSTFKQLGYPDLQISEVFGLFASSKTPAPVVAELEKAMVTAAKSARLVAAIEKLEFDSAVLNSVDLSRQLKADFERWGPVIKATGYTADK